MASVTTAGTPRGRSPEWARRYPPLLALAVAVALAIAILPSSLNLPQANPATTLELAPVPPSNDKTPPAQNGNLSSLSLATSSGIEGAGAPGGTGPGPGPVTSNAPKGPSLGGVKHCKGNPPRQTEDPLSPPCVATFRGDNGGATYQGVTGDEIRIVFYYDPGVFTPTARGADTTPSNKLIDLDAPPQPNEIGQITATRAWEHYFDERYQLYGRHAHFYMYYGTNQIPATPESRGSDAAEVYSSVHPFAVIGFTGLAGASDDFLKFMAQHGVLNFGSVQGRSAQFFQQFPKLVWGFPPTVESIAHSYSSAVCSMIANKPVSFAGTGIAAGTKRKYGVVYTSDATYPALQREEQLVEQGLKTCGITISDKVTYPRNGFTVDTETNPSYASTNMSKFQREGITTILWPGGVEIKQSMAATNIGYSPEWVLAGDGQQDAETYGQRQDQTAWAHAWIVTTQTLVGLLSNEICYQAYREVDPSAPSSDVQNFACPEYNDLRQLFTGIQVAGPKLGPTSIDKGYHAIPAVESPDPRVPACYYEVNDYTCVKDGVAQWWDPQAQSPTSNAPGCWREPNGGKRYLNTEWPSADITTLKNTDINVDPCNGYDTVENINNNPPSAGGTG